MYRSCRPVKIVVSRLKQKTPEIDCVEGTCKWCCNRHKEYIICSSVYKSLKMIWPNSKSSIKIIRLWVRSNNNSNRYKYMEHVVGDYGACVMFFSLENRIIWYSIDNIFFPLGRTFSSKSFAFKTDANWAPRLVDIYSIDRWSIVYQKSFLYGLSLWNISLWTWDQGNTRKRKNHFIVGCTTTGKIWQQWLPYGKRDEFHFHITISPFFSSNILCSLAYAILFLNSYGTIGLLPNMMIFHLRQTPCQWILIQLNVIECLKSSVKKIFRCYSDHIKA